MFYEVMGALMKAAAQPVATQNAQGDDVDRFHAQRVAQMLERIGGAWPYLLPALCQENEVLAEALGVDPEHDDPLAENRRLLELATKPWPPPTTPVPAAACGLLWPRPPTSSEPPCGPAGKPASTPPVASEISGYPRTHDHARLPAHRRRQPLLRAPGLLHSLHRTPRSEIRPYTRKSATTAKSGS